MSEKCNIDDLAHYLAKHEGISVADAQLFIESFRETLTQAFSEGRRVEFRGFGSFNVVNRKGGERHNPQNMERIVVDPSSTVRFKPSKNNVEIYKD